MVRTAAFVLGFILLSAGMIGVRAGWPGIAPAVCGAVLIVGLLFERYVYKPIRTEPPGTRWERTPERFADPGSGKNVVVYFNPRTGDRRYADAQQ
jgi:hypothetical protein